MQFERLNVHPGNLTCIPVYPKNHALEHVISGFTLWHHWVSMYVKLRGGGFIQGRIGCTPNSVPRVFIVFSGDSWGL